MPNLVGGIARTGADVGQSWYQDGSIRQVGRFADRMAATCSIVMLSSRRACSGRFAHTANCHDVGSTPAAAARRSNSLPLGYLASWIGSSSWRARWWTLE